LGSVSKPSLWEEGRRYILEAELEEAQQQIGRRLRQLDDVIIYLAERLGIPAPGIVNPASAPERTTGSSERLS